MEPSQEAENLAIAERWCASKGPGWRVLNTAGRGGTAPVFSVESPDGERAFKLLDAAFSDGKMGELTEVRIAKQVELGDHECPYLVKIYDGGRFDGRLFLLMNKAPGQELEKRLDIIPRSKIRQIVDQIAQACIFLRGKGLCHRDIKSANVFVSDDFEVATLLDLSVTREINDPVGIGTDHGGQLPVVATSRYTPPEYLFRLIDPSPALWHALDIYQLGGLLHDLIMREPMFQKDYLLSRENRYRFAWIVATIDPIVAASDIDQDLVLLARRALDKDWERRRQLQLEDFLNTSKARRANGLQALGLSPAAPAIQAKKPRNIHLRAVEIAKAIEDSLITYLRSLGVTANHDIRPGSSDGEKILSFNWDQSPTSTSLVSAITYRIKLNVTSASNSTQFALTASLSASINGAEKEKTIYLPQIADSPQTLEELGQQATAALGDLAPLLVGE